MRASQLKQLQSLGVTLPMDFNLSFPPKILPIIFFGTTVGDFLRQQLTSISPFDDDGLKANNLTFAKPVIDWFRSQNFLYNNLVYIRRNYDGSELYWLVTDLSYKDIGDLKDWIKATKGGILL